MQPVSLASVHWTPRRAADEPCGAEGVDGAPQTTVPLILLHGMTSASATFASVGQALADRVGTEVIALDLRGHGRTPEPPTDAAPDTPEYLELWRVEAMARDVLHFLRTRKTPNGADVVVDVLGHSWGAKVACALTQLVQRGDGGVQPVVAVRSVIIEDGALVPRERCMPEAETQLRVARAASLWRDAFPSMDEATEFCVVAMGDQSNTTTADYAGKIAENATKPGSYEVLFRPHCDIAWNHHATRYDAAPVWAGATFAGPMAAITAERGVFTRKQDRRALVADQEAARAKGLVREIVTIPRSRHNVHKTEPRQYVDFVCGFIAQLSAARS
eukprot:CAMPEP_0174856664 /NCGR_PEP_ID=MMETSP1114-20130205/36158_1 /TAXON_ID=312471 /ORGANISM="Neobodo designis, Strain CCAP 1951/1" /LENGTH=330 /DNA_ID=CAMNT_0016091469 /DNA_START=54 /DNA_END=1046 /DNA_ORIENTATION=-